MNQWHRRRTAWRQRAREERWRQQRLQQQLQWRQTVYRLRLTWFVVSSLWTLATLLVGLWAWAFPAQWDPWLRAAQDRYYDVCLDRPFDDPECREASRLFKQCDDETGCPFEVRQQLEGLGFFGNAR